MGNGFCGKENVLLQIGTKHKPGVVYGTAGNEEHQKNIRSASGPEGHIRFGGGRGNPFGHRTVGFGKIDAPTLCDHENKNDYAPFVKYMLGVIAAAYRDFIDRTKLTEAKKILKPDRIAEEIKNHMGTITKSEVKMLVPNVSQTTIQRTLTELVKQEKIKKIGDGRYTKYIWNWDKER